MAVARKSQVKKYRFELTRSAITGVGIVCFCIFLWMFLLGVWTGQSLLMPSSLAPVTTIDGGYEIIDLSEQKKHRP